MPATYRGSRQRAKSVARGKYNRFVQYVRPTQKGWTLYQYSRGETGGVGQRPHKLSASDMDSLRRRLIGREKPAPVGPMPIGIGTKRPVPISLKEANEFVVKYHRHHGPRVFHTFSLGKYEDGQLRGVAIVANPTAPSLDDGYTLEVSRLATDGTKNVASSLYAASWREAQRRGYKRIVTYTLESEPGTSLYGAGWIQTRKTPWNKWDEKHGRNQGPRENKIRWEPAPAVHEYKPTGKEGSDIPG